MYVQTESDTVPGSMAVGKACLPEILSSECIQLVAERPCRKSLRSQCEIAFEHQRIVSSHLLCRLAEKESPRNIGSTGPVLTTSVEHKQPVSLKYGRGLLGRTVVSKSSMSVESGNGRKRWSEKLFVLCSELLKPLGNRDFTIGCLGTIKFSEQFHHGDTIEYVGTPHPLDLHKGFPRLQLGGDIGSLHDVDTDWNRTLYLYIRFIDGEVEDIGSRKSGTEI